MTSRNTCARWIRRTRRWCRSAVRAARVSRASSQPLPPTTSSSRGKPRRVSAAENTAENTAMDTAMDADAAVGEGDAGADGRRARRVAGGGGDDGRGEPDDGDDGGGEAVDGGDAQKFLVQARRAGRDGAVQSAQGYQLTRVNVRDVSGEGLRESAAGVARGALAGMPFAPLARRRAGWGVMSRMYQGIRASALEPMRLVSWVRPSLFPSARLFSSRRAPPRSFQTSRHDRIRTSSTHSSRCLVADALSSKK